MKAQDDFLQTIEDFYKIHTHYEDSEKAKINKAWEYLLEYSKTHEHQIIGLVSENVNEVELRLTKKDGN